MDTLNASGDRNVGQAGTVGERTASDIGDAIGEGNARQAAAINERQAPNAYDRMSFNGAWDDDSSAIAGVAGDGDGAAVVGPAIELGLRRSGQIEQQQQQSDVIGNPVPHCSFHPQNALDVLAPRS